MNKHINTLTTCASSWCCSAYGYCLCNSFGAHEPYQGFFAPHCNMNCPLFCWWLLNESLYSIIRYNAFFVSCLMFHITIKWFWIWYCYSFLLGFKCIFQVYSSGFSLLWYGYRYHVTLCICHLHNLWCHKNIERHTVHTIVSWPNPKQWVIVHTSDLMMIIRQGIYILSIITRGMGKLKHTQPHILYNG